MGRRRSRADDQVGDEELDGVDKEQEGEVDKEEVGEQLKTKKVEEEDKKAEEEEDLEYLRLNCTRMGTRRATNFSQVCLLSIFMNIYTGHCAFRRGVLFVGCCRKRDVK